MKILGIETSCDDTGIAITDDLKVLSNVVASQIEVHQQYGGVFPMMAKREHQKNLIPVLIQALEKAGMLKKRNKVISPKDKKKLKEILHREDILYSGLIEFFEKYEKPDIDLLAITIGPGLEPCLWVGVNFAKALSYYWSIPVVPVNHIEGHILINFLKPKEVFPAISLVVSGGHTQIILMKKIGRYEVLGETRDDAAGECFDKTAKILGLGYPGGPIISNLAKKDSDFKGIKLPRPMIDSNDYDFSFSGLKTAVLYDFLKRKNKDEQYIIAMAKEIQQAIIDVLIKKTIKAGKDYKVKTIILGGGVSANSELNKQLENRTKRVFDNYLSPDVSLSTDNGLMIAIAGYYSKKKMSPKRFLKVEPDANLRL